MKKKILLLTAVATLGLTAATMAQNVPSYVPTNGLVSWWPFNGNANDESGNGNNGNVNGATLSNDRNGQTNSAYDFNGIANYIEVPTSSSLDFSANQQTIAFWMKVPQYPAPACCPDLEAIISKWDNSGAGGFLVHFAGNGSIFYSINNSLGIWGDCPIATTQYELNQYFHVVFTNDNDSLRAYVNNQIVNRVKIPAGTTIGNTASLPLFFGKEVDVNNYFNGQLDDIGIWNRALSQQEISDLYNAVNCANNTTITPQSNALQTGSTATFTATTSDPNPNYIWQSDFGQGYVALNDFGNYSGTNTNTLSISNVQLANHNEPIRVISTSGECIDTSEVATVSILDTCITLINDTTFITVTDTLLINTLITGINPPNNSNTIKVYPNPTNDHITIDYGNFTQMNGYQLRIENSLGQEVFQTSISQQNDYLNLNTWGGNGLYFVHIVDPQGNTIDIRKIVLQ
jgi:hypothetical protein